MKPIGSHPFAVVLTGLILLLFPFHGFADTGAGTASLQVHATVLSFIQARVISGPDPVTIGEEDINRGYIDGGASFLVELRTNYPGACLLSVAVAEWSIGDLQISEAGSGIRTGPGTVTIRLQARGRHMVTLAYRLLLGSNARPGRYPLPLSFSASPY